MPRRPPLTRSPVCPNEANGSSAGAPGITHEEEKAERGSTRCPGPQTTGHGAEADGDCRSRRAGAEPACSSPPLRPEEMHPGRRARHCKARPQARCSYIPDGGAGSRRATASASGRCGPADGSRGPDLCTDLQERPTPGRAAPPARQHLPPRGPLAGRAARRQARPELGASSQARASQVRRVGATGPPGP